MLSLLFVLLLLWLLLLLPSRMLFESTCLFRPFSPSLPPPQPPDRRKGTPL
jgi:hypothetical protein